MLNRRKRIAMLALGAALFAAPATARAQTPDASKGAAIALFDDASRVMSQGTFAEACPMLARSNEIAPSGGTLLTLAECYEKNGQFASAFTAYNEAAVRAQSAAKADPEIFARAAAARVEQRVSWLTVNMPPSKPGREMTMTRDGQVVPSAAWATPVMLDPGPHTIEVRAAGVATPWKNTFKLGQAAERKVIDVPDLTAPAQPAGGAAAATAPTPEAPSHPGQAAEPGSTQRLLGIGLGGVGVVGVALGVVFGLTASGKDGDAAKHCRTETLCDPEGVSLGKEADDAAAISTIAFIAGSAAIAGGVILYLTAPRASTTAWTTRLQMNARGLSAVTTF